MRKLTITLMVIAVVGLLVGTASATMIAGWDDWADTTTPYDADILETGFTADLASGTDRVTSGFYSNDGTFGSVPGASTTNTNGLLPRENGDNLVFTITLNNNSGTAYSIDSMHFDFEVRNDTGPDSFVVDYVSGGLGPDATEIGRVDNQPWNGYSSGGFDFTDHDFTLADTLTDTVLGNGDSAIFTITFNQRGDHNNSAVFDNLAIIPEPSSLALLTLAGGVCFILRRRFRR